MATKKSRSQASYVDQIEAIKDLGSSTVKSFTNDVIKESSSDFVKQLLGLKEDAKQGKRSGELKPGEEIDLRQEKKLQTAEPGINYAREIIRAEVTIANKDKHEVRARVQEIQIELKKLTKTSRELEVEFKDVSMEQLPVNPGKFHLNFFEWVLSQVRRARMRVEDSAHWMKTIKGKKNQRQYWSLFKRHGTSFGLSGERIVATQTG